MTRINIGILPSELCDQHLVAEYRELPRMIRLAQSWVKKDVSKLPQAITLGKGHMLSLVPYGWELASRWKHLREEMMVRGFRPTLPQTIFASYPHQLYRLVDLTLKWAFRPVVQERIRSRLSTAKRAPTWTRRTRPTWA